MVTIIFVVVEIFSDLFRSVESNSAGGESEKTEQFSLIEL